MALEVFIQVARAGSGVSFHRRLNARHKRVRHAAHRGDDHDDWPRMLVRVPDDLRDAHESTGVFN